MERNSPLRPLRPGRRRPGRGGTLTIRIRGCALGSRRSRPAAGTMRRNTTARLWTRPPSRRWTGRCGFLAIHARGCALGKSAFPPTGGNEGEGRNSPLRSRRPGRRRIRRRRSVAVHTRGSALGKSAFPHDSGNEAKGRNSPLRSRSAPGHATFRTLAILSQNGCAAGYAVKARLARSVLAYGCAPLRPAGCP